MTRRRHDSPQSGNVTCACPHCGREIVWSATALNDETVCPDCVSHYIIKKGTGEFVSGPKFVDPLTRLPLERL